MKKGGCLGVGVCRELLAWKEILMAHESRCGVIGRSRPSSTVPVEEKEAGGRKPGPKGA